MLPPQTKIPHDLVKNRPRYDQASLERLGIEGFQQVIKLRERRFRRLRLFFYSCFTRHCTSTCALEFTLPVEAKNHPQDSYKFNKLTCKCNLHLKAFFITRSLSRAHCLSLMESRLSCSCLPLATPISSLAQEPFQ